MGLPYATALSLMGGRDKTFITKAATPMMQVPNNRGENHIMMDKVNARNSRCPDV
jgi:hypothetical protein